MDQHQGEPASSPKAITSRTATAKKHQHSPPMALPYEDAACLKDQMDRILTEQEPRKEERIASHQSNTGFPPMPLRQRTNKEFIAWAEYMGEEKDVEFIEWKKAVLGENHRLPVRREPNAENGQRSETKKK